MKNFPSFVLFLLATCLVLHNLPSKHDAVAFPKPDKNIIQSQTEERLRAGQGYCCLGVLCDISDKGEWKKTYPHSSTYSYWVKSDKDDIEVEGNLDGLEEILGIKSDSGELPLYETDASTTDKGRCSLKKTKKYNSQLTLATLNDENFTFAQIADVIEYFADYL